MADLTMATNPYLAGAELGVGTITDIIGLYMQYQAIQKQIKESQRVEAIQTAQWNKQFGLSETLGLGNLALGRRQQKFQEKESALNRQERLENTKFDRVQTFKNNFTDALNSNINYRNRLISMWRM